MAALVPITGYYVDPSGTPLQGSIYVEKRDQTRGDGAVWVGVSTALVTDGAITGLSIVAPSSGAYRYRFTEHLSGVNPDPRYELDVHAFDAATGIDLTVRSPDDV